MRFLRSTLFALLAVALTAYAIDCGAVTTPDQAMQCCKSMPCHSHGQNSGDCCKTMTAQHAPFLPATFSAATSLHAVATPVVVVISSRPNAFHAQAIAALSHAPPLSSATASTPLRI